MQPQDTNPAPKKAATPAKQYGCLESLGMILIAFVGLGIYLGLSSGGEEKNSSASSNQQYQTEQEVYTPLTHKAMQLVEGLERHHVIKRLGQPDWIILPSDKHPEWQLRKPFTLRFVYRNPQYSPVILDFGEDNLLANWDEGRAPCKDDEAKFLPPDQFSAKLPDRRDFANVWIRDKPSR